MVRRLGLGKNNHLTYDSLALNPRYVNSKKFKQACESTVSPEPMLYAHVSGRLKGNFNQRTTHVALLRGWPRGYKTFFMLKSAEHEICPANKSQYY